MYYFQALEVIRWFILSAFFIGNCCIPQVATNPSRDISLIGSVIGEVSYKDQKTASYQLKINGIVSSSFSLGVSELQSKDNADLEMVRLSFLINPDGTISNIKTEQGNKSALHDVALKSLKAVDRMKPFTEFDDATLKANPSGIKWALSFIANNLPSRGVSLKRASNSVLRFDDNQTFISETEGTKNTVSPRTYYNTDGTWMGNINQNGSVSDTGGNWVGNVGRNGAVYDANCNWVGNINQNGSISDPSGNWIGNTR